MSILCYVYEKVNKHKNEIRNSFAPVLFTSGHKETTNTIYLHYFILFTPPENVDAKLNENKYFVPL